VERAGIHAEHRRDSDRAGGGRRRRLTPLTLEIERKFRPPGPPPWLSELRSEQIDQGYLAVVEGEVEVRVRRRGDATVLTVKRGSGETREEVEIDLDEGQFDALWPLTEGRRVAKSRHVAEEGGLTFEIDVYEGGLEGMITVEVEFDSQQASREFEPPEWIGREVTDEPAYSNESLAIHGRPEGEDRGREISEHFGQ
jgi:CYTH domain-containing protein